MSLKAEINYKVAPRITEWLANHAGMRDTSIEDVHELGAALGTTRGLVRTENQDRVIVARYSSGAMPGSGFVLYTLCDGMGGMADGAKCAELTIGVLIDSLVRSGGFDIAGRLSASVEEANQYLNSLYEERGGTTITALAVSTNGNVAALNVGDSRIYECNEGSPKRLQQISVDDTIAGELGRLRGESVSLVGGDDYMGRLAQYVGLGEGLMPRIYGVEDFDLNSGFLLTSDGIHGVSRDTLSKIATTAAPNQLDVVKRLLHVSLWAGGSDNASAIFIRPSVIREVRPRQDLNVNLLEMWSPFGKMEMTVEPVVFSANMDARKKKQAVSDLNASHEKEANRNKVEKNKKQAAKQVKSNKKVGAKKKKSEAKQKQLDISITLEEEAEDGNDKAS